jgi:hypothetical protein
MSTLETLKKNLMDQVRYRLGDGIVDIEADPQHFEMAYQRAVQVFRQRSSAAYEESYMLMPMQEGVNVYTLPQEVTHVRQVFRRTMGDATGPYSSSFDPFSSATLNVYLLNYNAQGGLFTYDLYTQYVEQAARMFGGFINFTFNSYTKQIQLIRDPKGNGEPLLLWVYNLLPEVQLLSDYQISPWISDYAYAATKMAIGEAREKFTTIAGPQGGTSLNGSQMKTEAQAEMDKLIVDLGNFIAGGPVLSWIVG